MKRSKRSPTHEGPKKAVKFARFAPIAAGLIVLLCGYFAWQAWSSFKARQEAQRLYSTAVLQSTEGDHRSAADSAEAAWQKDHSLTDALQLAAESALASEQPDRARTLIESLAEGSQKEKLTAAQLEAALYRDHQHEFARAEKAYRRAIELAPDNVAMLKGLAELYAMCGRRTDAVPLVLRLIQLGQEPELMMLIAREDAVVSPEVVQQAMKRRPQDPMSIAARAWRMADAEDSKNAISLLKEGIGLHSEARYLRAMLLKQLVVAEDWNEVRATLIDGRAGPAMDQYAETWNAMAFVFEQADDMAGAMRCYAEALQRAPDSKTALTGLARTAARCGEQALADEAAQSLKHLQGLREQQDRFFFSGQAQSANDLLKLVEAFEACGRTWEAYGWCRVGQESAGPAGSGLNSPLRSKLDTLSKRIAGLPLRLVEPDRIAGSRLDHSRYPIPQLPKAGSKPAGSLSPQVSPSTASASFAMTDRAVDIGLDFRYFNGIEDMTQHRMFELTGGGIGVIDFDLDGRPDLALSQGSSMTPDSSHRELKDKLFRNLDGKRFEAIPDSALQLDEDAFGQGVAVGDFDNDGFADLYVAQIGRNRLLHNNGDGTFSDCTAKAGIRDQAWTTSCLCADLTGDGNPDLFDVNYVQAPDCFTRVCRDETGRGVMCMPADFDEAPDTIMVNQGDGTFVSASELTSIEPSYRAKLLGKGLGVAAFAPSPGEPVHVFIANDTTPCYWLVPKTKDGVFIGWEEQGVAAGVAYNAESKATGSMGIAVGDVNHDRQTDMLITNFYNEPNTLFINQGNGLFGDRTNSHGLREPSLKVLGFGTQFIDLDNDGTNELFVANGHIDDLTHRGVPYAMSAQLFRSSAGRFQTIIGDKKLPYLARPHLGRAVARLDWNSDGKSDLVVGHLHENISLLQNETPTDCHCVRLRLIGTVSSRDAVGAWVTAKCGDATYSAQVTAGDGYQASNQRELIMGIGRREQVDELTVHWPSGHVQSLKSPPSASELTIVEDR